MQGLPGGAAGFEGLPTRYRLFKPCLKGLHGENCAKVNVFDPLSRCSCECHKREEMKKREAALTKALAQAIELLESGRLCSIGSYHNTREVQVDVASIEALKSVLTQRGGSLERCARCSHVDDEHHDEGPCGVTDCLCAGMVEFHG